MGNAVVVGPGRMVVKDGLPVIETFVSLQGEGPSSGEPALFLRLANCNLSCSWCDTRHSWDWENFDQGEEVESLPLTVLGERLVRTLTPNIRLLVLTGGEPLLHQSALAFLLTTLRARRPDVRVEVETNGTIAPTPALSDLVHLFVVSPKLANSGIEEKRRIRPVSLAGLRRLPSVLKFVVETATDITDAVDIADAHGFTRDRVWVMPQTTSASEIGSLIATLAPTAISAGVKMSSRLHVLAWGDTRGT